MSFKIFSALLSSVSLFEDQMNDRHLILSIELSVEKYFVKIIALIDSEATSIVFVDIVFAQKHRFALKALLIFRVLKFVDDRSISIDQIKHIISLRLEIAFHEETLLFFLTDLDHYSVILDIK